MSDTKYVPYFASPDLIEPHIKQIWTWDWKASGLQQLAEAERVAAYLATQHETVVIKVLSTNGDYHALVVATADVPDELDEIEYAPQAALEVRGVPQERIEEIVDNEIQDALTSRVFAFPADWDSRKAQRAVTPQVLAAVAPYITQATAWWTNTSNR